LAAQDPNFLYLWALYGPSTWWSVDHPNHPVAPPLVLGQADEKRDILAIKATMYYLYIP